MRSQTSPFLFAAAVLAAVLTAQSTGAQACACCGTYQVVGVAADDALNIRSGPGAAYPRIGSIPSGSACVIRQGACSRSWCKVSYAETKGWVNTRYLRYMARP